ncbi:23341_t:CDS:2 [Cetraspora pellucida]|uniref:23341_t:CDS:1 n=1 Tax=Cetraspora pellucida TaxID=1433469 RepID=A0A9N9N5Y0_9GLOM|nr:23341_t:CDS:2 [Cetraspora pellucida]
MSYTQKHTEFHLIKFTGLKLVFNWFGFQTGVNRVQQRSLTPPPLPPKLVTLMDTIAQARISSCKGACRKIVPVAVYLVPGKIGQSVELQKRNVLGVCTGTVAPIVTTTEASGSIARPDTCSPLRVKVIRCGVISGSGFIITENVSSTPGHGPKREKRDSLL